MSTEEPKEFARELFVGLVQAAGPGEWDWQKIAQKAFDAAEAFEVIAIQRPQQSVPIESPQRVTTTPVSTVAMT